MIARALVWVGASRCFVGYPSSIDGQSDEDTGVLLPDPRCDASSIEPDDGETEVDVSQVGTVLSTVRTFCGRVDEASNNGETFTGDLDVALVHTLAPGRLSLVLSWEDGRTDLDVLLSLDPEGAEWALGGDGVVEERLEAGVYTVIIAGTDGPATDYQMDVWLEQ